MTALLFFSPFCISWKKEDDVRIEAFEDDSETEGSGGEMDIKELRAKKQALARKVAEQQRRQDKIQVGWADPTSLCQWCTAVFLPCFSGLLGCLSHSTLTFLGVMPRAASVKPSSKLSFSPLEGPNLFCCPRPGQDLPSQALK